MLGVRFMNEALISLSAPAAGSSIHNVPFSQKSTVPVFGLDIGFTFDLGEHFFVGVDTGIRYQSPPDSFGYLPSLSGIDDSDGRWSAPVTAVIGVRF